VHDWICPPEFSREIAALIPGSRLVEIENSSHSVRVDAPDVLLRELAAFILHP
jgi:proline iminopeptidase